MILTDKIIIDSVRHIDSNGYMRVDKSNITKEQVAPYRGSSIPEWQELGLQPDKVYQIYRPAEELEKAVQSFNGLPLMLEHWSMDADTIGQVKDKVVGSLGTDAKYEAPYLTNSLIITDAKAIKEVESGRFKELSAGYNCKLDMKGGMFDGVAYDGVMFDIEGNHVALVNEGRAGHDVKVADSVKGGENVGAIEKLKQLLVEIFSDKEVLKELMNENEMEVEKTPVETEEVKEEEVKTEEVKEETVDEEPVDELADELREKMKAAGLDPEDKAAQKAFLAGMAAAAEPAEDACKDACKDEEAPAEKVTDAKEHFAGLYRAAEEVAPFVGKINNPFAFDSAADIYKKALVKAGIKLDGIDPVSYGAMVSMLQKPQPVAMGTDTEDPMNKRLMSIRKSY